MLIKAYRVESRRHGSIAFEPPEPVLIGIVQFTGGIDEGSEEWQRESEAVNLLMDHSPFAHDPMRGADTWDAALIVVDDESLEAPSFDDAPKGYRIWLRSWLPLPLQPAANLVAMAYLLGPGPLGFFSCRPVPEELSAQWIPSIAGLVGLSDRLISFLPVPLLKERFLEINLGGMHFLKCLGDGFHVFGRHSGFGHRANGRIFRLKNYLFFDPRAVAENVVPMAKASWIGAGRFAFA
jgi:hypothetical protein